jgi:hypothetical protein
MPDSARATRFFSATMPRPSIRMPPPSTSSNRFFETRVSVTSVRLSLPSSKLIPSSPRCWKRFFSIRRWLASLRSRPSSGVFSMVWRRRVMLVDPMMRTSRLPPRLEPRGRRDMGQAGRQASSVGLCADGEADDGPRRAGGLCAIPVVSERGHRSPPGTPIHFDVVGCGRAGVA